MKTLRLVARLVALSCLPTALLAADSPTFRGPDRDGIYHERGLLPSWPEGGPRQLWITTGLGEGYSSMAVADGRIFTTGISGGRGQVFAFDTLGKRLWSTVYGPEHSGSGYPGARTTPTVHGGSVFLVSALGRAVALEAETGAIRWQIDLFERFKGAKTAADLSPRWGVAESPLVVDGKVIFTAGGPDATLVALDAATGEVAWSTAGLSDRSAYCSARLFDDGKRRQIITFVQEHLIGVDIASGELLWKQRFPAEWEIHAVSPVFDGSRIYVTHGYDQGGAMFELAADGKSVSQRWREPRLDVHHGGAVVVDGRVYGAASNKDWLAVDLASGQVVAEIDRLGKGAVVYADGRLYGYTEAGRVVLVDPNPQRFQVVGSFEVKEGNGHHWAHPVISDGILYLRHGDVLMAYLVRNQTDSEVGEPGA